MINKRELAAFIGSPAWIFVKGEYLAKAEQVKVEMLATEDIDKLRALQIEARTVIDMAELPEIYLENLEDADDTGRDEASE